MGDAGEQAVPAQCHPQRSRGMPGASGLRTVPFAPFPPALPLCQPFSPHEGHSLALLPPQLQRGQGGDLGERAGSIEIGGSMQKRQKVLTQGSGLQSGKGHPHAQPTLERFITGRVLESFPSSHSCGQFLPALHFNKVPC